MPRPRLLPPRLAPGLVALTGAAAMLASVVVRADPPAAAPASPFALLDRYCSGCHNDIDKVAGRSFDDLRETDLAAGLHAEDWERILRRTSLDEMPPHARSQPSPADRAAFVAWLQAGLDARAVGHPDPGRAPVRRLNRMEYANAVRDLLALPVDLSRDLPPDDSGYGFDNVADVLSISPTLMDRYLAVAGKVARLATGLASPRAITTAYEVPKDGSVFNGGRPAYNERASDDLPLGSRGGGAFRYYARHGGLYEIAGQLNANTNNETDRLAEDRVAVTVPLRPGPHIVGMSFRRALAPDESVQTLRNTLDAVPLPTDPPRLLALDVSVDGRIVQTLQVPSYRLSPRYSQHNFPRDVQEIDVTGPIGAVQPGDTPSRRRIFVCRPRAAAAETACAGRIAATLARLAWRRPVSPAELAPLLKVYAGARAGSDFDHGVAALVEALLVSPRFLIVAETDPAGALPGSVHPVSDLDLATRLSLFLWSSIPDEPLLQAAESGRLHDPAELRRQVARMLDDDRADALTANFAGQWLYLRNLQHQRPDWATFPNFDVRLRQAMARETEMFFADILRNDRSLLHFIDADYTFLNQRLAEHYGIAGVSGTAFRKVALDPAWHRGGLLGQASILTVTSYGNRTSVVKRGKWILDNLLAAPPPPPPADVPALKESHDGKLLTAREQLELHRAQPACAACHARMDPLGFALENYDAVGAWRTRDAGQEIDASAALPDGRRFDGGQGLRALLLARKDQFAGAFTERLMTYALGRGLGAQDMPAVRGIVHAAAADGYRARTVIAGIATSVPFTLRKVPER